MATPQQVSWALGSPAVVGIADDEAPTAFYRRRRSAKHRARRRPLPASRSPPKARPAPPQRPPASPATLLLPTGSPSEATSDGTILSARPRSGSPTQRAALPRAQSLAKRWRSLSQAATEYPALRGYGLLTSAVALGLLGVLAVTYAYIMTTDVSTYQEVSAGHAGYEHGFIHRACDLSKRLERIQQASINHHAEP